MPCRTTRTETPHVSSSDHPIRRKVALARPEAYSDQVAASHNVALFISSAINAGPAWFWRNVRKGDY
jgi:hypothetical protein